MLNCFKAAFIFFETNKKRKVQKNRKKSNNLFLYRKNKNYVLPEKNKRTKNSKNTNNEHKNAQIIIKTVEKIHSVSYNIIIKQQAIKINKRKGDERNVQSG